MTKAFIIPMWDKMRISSAGFGEIGSNYVVSNYKFNYLYCYPSTPYFPNNLELVE
jgi:hypothetical protein